MTYRVFLENLRLYLLDTKVAGDTLFWYSDICLEDEIELSTGVTYPAFFIVPVPFDILDSNTMKYTAKIYMVDNVGRSPRLNGSRLYVYNLMVAYAQAFLQTGIPENYIPVYPITISPIVKWDANVDGIYFEISLNVFLGCL